MAFELQALFGGLMIICTPVNDGCKDLLGDDRAAAYALLARAAGHSPQLQFPEEALSWYDSERITLAKAKDDPAMWRVEISDLDLCLDTKEEEPGGGVPKPPLREELRLTGGKGATQKQPSWLRADATAFGWLARLSETGSCEVELAAEALEQPARSQFVSARVRFAGGELSSHRLGRVWFDTWWRIWGSLVVWHVDGREYRTLPDWMTWRRSKLDSVVVSDCGDPNSPQPLIELETRRARLTLTITNLPPGDKTPSSSRALNCEESVEHFRHLYRLVAPASTGCNLNESFPECPPDIARRSWSIFLNSNVFCPPAQP